MAAITWICWSVGSFFAGLGVLWLALALFRDRSRGRRRCPRCWYDMAGVPELTCPECGKRFAAERLLKKTRRHRRQALGALVLVLLGYLGVRTPDVLSDGALAVVPTLPLRIAMSFFDEDSDSGSVSSLRITISPGSAPSQFMLPPPSAKTWWERTELNWADLQRASRARKIIKRAIALAMTVPESDDALYDLRLARRELAGVGVESRIALDAVRALVRKRDSSERSRLIGIQMLIDMGDDVRGAKRTLSRVARSDREAVKLRVEALGGLVLLGEKLSAYRATFRDLLSVADWPARPFKRTSVRAARIAEQASDEMAIAELTGAFYAGDCVTRAAIRITFEASYATTPITTAMSELLNREYATRMRSAIEGLSHSDLPARLIAAGELRGMQRIGLEDAERCLDALDRSDHPLEQRYLVDLIRYGQIKGERASDLLKGRAGVEEAINLGYSALLAASETCSDEVVVEIAMHGLKDPYPHTRYLAAWMLGRRGAAARIALPALKRSLNDEFGSVQKAADEAISAIEASNEAVQDPPGQPSVLPGTAGGP